ncbi:winged helix-turn-helix transcriptional regulator [Enterococcus avium]|uniref:winged helix-turn-helix transcriptional regulator n=1 Tax=Enterococcus avium TaxID=33945 RepID=UPI0026F481CB|nr:helix-turn-helix domain-containing protein [Enterococcus avium]MDO7798998.1 helix-turn-helix domain-containing protein [Enterococcus avium]
MHNDKADDLRLRKLAMPLLGKWVPFILILLSERPHHFADLERELTGISRKVLAENLSNLLSYGIIEKNGQTSNGFPVYYHLTQLGKSSLFILKEVKAWLKKNESEINKNREFYVANKDRDSKTP